MQVEKYDRPWLMMSDLEVAGIIEAHGNHVQSKFGKGDLEVVPMPSRTFVPEQPVYLCDWKVRGFIEASFFGGCQRSGRFLHAD